MIGAYGAAAIAVAVGLFTSPIPKQMGVYRWLAKSQPYLTGFTPAYSYGVEWRFTAEELYSTIDLTGQTALVTGANSGIGYEIAKGLARVGATVIVACRNETRCVSTVESIQSNPNTTGKVLTLGVELDTNLLSSVKWYAQAYRRIYGHQAPLDMLFLNAGTVYHGTCVPINEDGIETTFATNYVGHHLLYRWMLPYLQQSKVARVVSTSSAAAFDSFPDVPLATNLEELNDRTCTKNISKTNGLSYGQSKLAQLVWTKYVQRSLGGNESNIFVNSFHPGAAATEIWDKALEPTGMVAIVLQWLMRDVMWSPEEGALTGLFLGTSVDRLKQENVRGKHFHPQTQEVVHPSAANETLQELLWEFSEELVKKYLPFENYEGVEHEEVDDEAADYGLD